MSKPTIDGAWSLAFEPAVEAFRQNFSERGEVGAGFCVFQHGKPVVDVWGGVADVRTGRPWERDTIGVMFSATKGLVALAFLMLEDRGLVDLDLPVARWWPEFAEHGKADITVRTLLNHRAGLSAVDEPLKLHDFHDAERVEPALARQQPMWPPGTAQGYGATAWGMYAGALFRRIAAENLGSFLQREVFGRMGVDLWLGLPRQETRRLATLIPLGGSDILRRVLPALARGGTLESRVYRALVGDRASDTARALNNPHLGRRRLNSLNDPAVLEMELPWMNAVGSARGLAAVYAALATDGTLGDVQLVRPQSLQPLLRRQSWSWQDRVMLKPMGFSQGFMKDEPHLFSPNEASFGHPGAGGALGLADPTHGLSIGYIMNRMDHHLRSPRALALCHAVYRCLGYG